MPAIPAELLESFGNGSKTAEAINAASLAFKKALIERALDGELNHHLGYPSGTTKPTGATNQRNSKGAKTVLTEGGPIYIEVPRDRDGSFEPLLIPKHERRFTGFDDKIVAMYARGMTVREIQGFLQEHYGTEVSPEFIRLAAAIRPIYTTNAIENINSQLRKIIKTRGHFPSDQATTKLISLALLNITAKWEQPARN